jgi:hypothetical protein
MSIAMASLSQTAIADATNGATKKVPLKRQTIVAATAVLVPQPR